MKTLYLFLAILGCLYQKAYACSCYEDERTLVEAFNGVDVLFVGSLQNIRAENNYEVIATFKVTIPLKNASQHELVEITTPLDEGGCGLYFDFNDEWMIWGYKLHSDYKSNSCTRSKNLNKNQNQPILQELIKLSTFTGNKSWFHKNKTLGSKGAMKKGLPDGSWEYYYPDGSLKAIGSYDQGIKTGTWKAYRDTSFWHLMKKGWQLDWEYAQANCMENTIHNEAEHNSYYKKEETLYLISSYKDGKLEGEVCEYMFGQLGRKTTYRNGRKHGHDTSWDLWYLDERVSSDELYTYGVLVQTLK